MILTGEVWDSAGVPERVESEGVRPSHFQAKLRGVQFSRELVRLRF